MKNLFLALLLVLVLSSASTDNGSVARSSLNVTAVNPPENQKHVINWPQSDKSGAPDNLIKNWDYIETLPFDGVVIFTPEFRDAMTPGKTVTYKQVFTDSKLAELSKKFNKVCNNFLVVWAAPAPIDAFDNWDNIVANFAVYAKAAHDAGCSGILFDTEQYRGGIWNYPENVSYSNKYSIEQYRKQMRMRGKQIMTALVAQYPDIQIIVSHGPYWSEPQAYKDMPEVGAQIPANTGNLIESFYSGFVEASVIAREYGSLPKFIDGGELYKLRTRADFTKSYNWRKDTIASEKINSVSIPASLRPEWANNVSISFGIYNLPWEGPMNPLIMRTTIEQALIVTDDLIWIYTEGMDWYVPGAVSRDWIDAVKYGMVGSMGMSTKKKH